MKLYVTLHTVLQYSLDIFTNICDKYFSCVSFCHERTTSKPNNLAQNTKCEP